MNGERNVPQEVARGILADTLDYFERNPYNHTTGVGSRRQIGADDGFARCWLGAMYYLAPGEVGVTISQQVRAASMLVFPSIKHRSAVATITEFNDDRGREAVIAKLREVLA